MALAPIDPTRPRPPSTPPLTVPPISSVALDPTFGAGGVATGIPFIGNAAGLRVQPDGSLLVATFDDDRLRLVRLAEDGSVDGSFGNNGVAAVVDAAVASSVPVTVLPDGRMLLGTVVRRSDDELAWLIARLMPDGTPDPSFSADGMINLTFPGFKTTTAPRVIAAGSASTIVAVGVVGVGEDDNDVVAIAQVLADGSIDRTFGEQGKAVVRFPGIECEIRDAAIGTDGSVLMCGFAVGDDTSFDFFVTRITAAGRLDATFGVGGVAVVDFGIGGDVASAAALQADGRLLIAGHATTDLGTDAPAVVRLTPNGSLDTSFGTGGRVRIDTGPAPRRHSVSAVRQLSDGRVVVAGRISTVDRTNRTRRSRPFVACLTADGRPDTRFEPSTGVALMPVQNVKAGALQVLPDDRMVLAYSDGTVLRLLPESPAPTAVSLTITPSQPVAGPGPLSFFATVRNDGPSPAAGVQLNLVASKAFGIGSVSSQAAISHSDPRSAMCVFPVVAAGATSRIELLVAVSGREGSVVVRGAVASATADSDALDNQDTATVQTFAVTPI